MPPIRTPPTPINPNRLPGHRLTPIERAEVCILYKAGLSYGEIWRGKSKNGPIGL